MFKNIKKQIKELAKNAVLKAEQELGSGKGQQKKRVAIDYVLKNLPIPEFMKMIVSVILSSFIFLKNCLKVLPLLNYIKLNKTNGTHS